MFLGPFGPLLKILRPPFKLGTVDPSTTLLNSQVGFVLFYLRGPLKIGENLGMATMFLSTLTPKVNI